MREGGPPGAGLFARRHSGGRALLLAALVLLASRAAGEAASPAGGAQRRRGGGMKPEVRRAAEEFVREARRRADGSIERIVLFGSQARGDAGADSDIDILVVWTGKSWEGWETAADLATKALLRHGVNISAKVFSPKEMAQMEELGLPFIRNVLREGREL